MKSGEVAVLSGSRGFIGRNLAGLLIEKGLKVAGIPQELLDNPTVLSEWLKAANPDYIFHLAAFGNHSWQRSKRATDDIFAANVMKTYLMLKVSLPLDYKAFFNFSTSSVYGQKDLAMRESMKMEPESFYAATKACGEHLASQFAKDFDKPIVNIRPFSIYGEGEAALRFIPTVIKSFVLGDSFSLYPNPAHDWTHVEDLIHGLFTIVDNIEELKGQPINIGTGQQHTNLEVVETLEKIIGEKANYSLVEGSPAGQKDNWRANNLLLKKYGWKPTISFKKGLERTYKFYKEYFLNPPTETDLDEAMKNSLESVGSEGFK